MNFNINQIRILEKFINFSQDNTQNFVQLIFSMFLDLASLVSQNTPDINKNPTFNLFF